MEENSWKIQKAKSISEFLRGQDVAKSHLFEWKQESYFRGCAIFIEGQSLQCPYFQKIKIQLRILRIDFSKMFFEFHFYFWSRHKALLASSLDFDVWHRLIHLQNKNIVKNAKLIESQLLRLAFTHHTEALSKFLQFPVNRSQVPSHAKISFLAMEKTLYVLLNPGDCFTIVDHHARFPADFFVIYVWLHETAISFGVQRFSPHCTSTFADKIAVLPCRPISSHTDFKEINICGEIV